MKKIKYFCKKDWQDYFFVPALQSYIERLDSALKNSHTIRIYPDACFKKNLFPSGLALHAHPQEAILMPQHLRDPGCGFLMFKLKFQKGALVSPSDLQGCAKKLNKLMAALEAHTLSLTPLDFEAVLQKGIAAIDIPAQDYLKYVHPHFFVKRNIASLLTAEEKQLLHEDWGVVTNTIEIRQVDRVSFLKAQNNQHEIHDGDLVGFIHSGSVGFPKILSERFLTKIVHYGVDHELFSLDNFGEGLFGIPYHSETGQEYATWLKSAMNFAIANRYIIFQTVRDLLEQTLQCEVLLLNDVTHAGLFEYKDQVVATRGVQPLTVTDYSASQLRLIAGERETIATLVSIPAKNTNASVMLPHGTGYAQAEQSQITPFKKSSSMDYELLAKQCYYNTNPNYDTVWNLTFNHIKALTFFMEEGVCQPLAQLNPMINLQSMFLKRSA